MSSSEEHPEHREGSPLSQDVVVREISGPDDYQGLCKGPVVYVLLANPVGIIGALWASDDEEASSRVKNKEQGAEAWNKGVQDWSSGIFWIKKRRSAKTSGLKPTEFLAEIQTSQDSGGWPFPGRVLPGPLRTAESLQELKEYIENEVPRPNVAGRELRSYAAAPHEAEYSASQQGFVVPTTDEIRKMAAYASNPKAQRWWTVVDRSFPDLYAEQVPLQHVFGGWVIEPDGSLSDFIVNREYQPTLVGLGWRAAVNEFEGSIQRRHMGRESDAAFSEHFHAAELIVPVGEGGSYAIERDAAGQPALRVYSSDGQLPTGGQRWARTTGAELVRTQAPELSLTINPGSRPETQIVLRQAATGA